MAGNKNYNHYVKQNSASNLRRWSEVLKNIESENSKDQIRLGNMADILSAETMHKSSISTYVPGQTVLDKNAQGKSGQDENYSSVVAIGKLISRLDFLGDLDGIDFDCSRVETKKLLVKSKVEAREKDLYEGIVEYDNKMLDVLASQAANILNTEFRSIISSKMRSSGSNFSPISVMHYEPGIEYKCKVEDNHLVYSLELRYKLKVM